MKPLWRSFRDIIFLLQWLIFCQGFTSLRRLHRRDASQSQKAARNHLVLYRYQIIERVSVLTANSTAWNIWEHCYTSRSKFRKACRHGELIVLRPRLQEESGHNEKEDGEERVADLDWVDHASKALLINRHAFWLVPSTILQVGDTLARIVRCSNDNNSNTSGDHTCYPQSVTGFVTPPPVVTSGRFTALHNSIVYQDKHLAVVDKPEGLVTIGVPRQDLQSALPFCLAPPPAMSASKISLPTSQIYTPRPIHRLDKATRGLLIVAKDAITLTRLSQALAAPPDQPQSKQQRYRVTKTYAALVRGRVATDRGVLDIPIDGKTAISTYCVQRRTRSFTLLHVQPQTGRFHQVRRHLHYGLGHTIYGDTKYDPQFRKSRKEQHQYDNNDGLFLCANRLEFDHPITQETIVVSIELPRKYQRVLEADDEKTPNDDHDNEDDDNDDDDNDDDDNKEATASPTMPNSVGTHRTNSTRSFTSPSFDAYVASVRQEHEADFATTDGVFCTGEPAVDPSKLVRANQGDSEWVDDW